MKEFELPLPFSTLWLLLLIIDASFSTSLRLGRILIIICASKTADQLLRVIKKKHLVAMVTHCNNCPKVGRNRNHSYYTAKPTDLLQHTANLSAAILLFRASINWLCPLSIHFIISPSICISTHIFIYHPIPPWFFHPSKFQPSIHFCI